MTHHGCDEAVDEKVNQGVSACKIPAHQHKFTSPEVAQKVSEVFGISETHKHGGYHMPGKNHSQFMSAYADACIK